MNKTRRSFSNQLILNFTFVIFGGFLAIYFLFNALMDNHIKTEAQTELNREIMTIVESEPSVSTPIARFDGNNYFEIIFSTPIRRNRAILNVDTILLDHNGMLILPIPFELPEDELARVETLITYYHNNQSLFEAGDEMVMASHDGHTFYLRATNHYLVQSGSFAVTTIPVSVLMYTDITPAMNLKSSMNQILLILLGISGTMSLAISVIISYHFRKSINRLANHAKVIGEGRFDVSIDNFNYIEFNNLANSMNNMSSMLGSYEKNQNQFFQNASHELRTPLMSIQGYAEGLKLGVFTPDNATDVILDESKKMTELVNDVLYLSRLNTGKESELKLTSVAIDEMILGCTHRVKIIAEKANKQVIIDLESTKDLSIITDQKKLERAIINILTNAIRYAALKILIKTYICDNKLHITITNDGPKINKKDLPHIFDRFYKGASGNTGLGLAITKEIITILSGTVEAINLEDKDQGVQFIITFQI